MRPLVVNIVIVTRFLINEFFSFDISFGNYALWDYGEY